MATCCIVTSDIAPLEKNGGVGSACYHLALELVKSGVSVTILYFNWESKKDMPHWIQWYGALGVIFIPLQKQRPYKLSDEAPNYRASYDIRCYLEAHPFGYIHFMDYCGLGFHTIQAKRTMGLFGASVLTVTVHCPYQWILEGMEQWPPAPLEGIKRDYMERYSCAHADVLTAPSSYMIDWLRRNHWALPADTRVMPNCFAPRRQRAAYAPDPRRLIFFGRLEKRKGLDVFCHAVDKLLRDDPEAVSDIAFLGKLGDIDGMRADEYIRQALGTKVRYALHTNYNYVEAHDYIEKNGGLVVAPSYTDNHSYALIECVSKGYPFLCSDVGGNREIASERVCFTLTPDALAQAIRDAGAMDFTGIEHPYDADAAAASWVALHSERFARTQPVTDAPFVSVCVPYYNHGAFLDRCMNALLNDGYPNKEIIIVDDGSTDQASIDALAALEARAAGTNGAALPCPVHIHRKPNGGPGHTRNYAVARARGDYIVFADADNISSPHMIAMMARGIQHSGAHCLTVYANVFTDADTPGNIEEGTLVYAPMGGCAQYAVFTNTVGDTNAILRKDALLAVGGFEESLRQYEDWHLFVKLMLEGYDVDTMPAPLFFYRQNVGGVNSSANIYRGHTSIAALYKRRPDLCAAMLDYFHLPMYHSLGDGTGGMVWRVAKLLWGIASKLMPPGSKRRLWAKKLFS